MGQLTGPLPGLDAGDDFFCYYGAVGEVEVWQAQYFDVFILEPDRASADQIADIRNGFDDLSGTSDDVLVFGYLTVGECHAGDAVGDGTGPVYLDNGSLIFQNNGYASFYLDDHDQDGLPDMNGTWLSFFVNAGDTAWWEYNRPRVEEVLLDKGCDGLFLDTMGAAAPQSWGNPYYWIVEGMAYYTQHLRTTYPDKYLFGNNPAFYFHTSLPGYAYRDIIRSSLNAFMYESYYLTWDWDNEVGYVSPWFEGARDTWAPLINDQSAMADGFTTVALDYLAVGQDDYIQLLDNLIQETESAQNWMAAVSSIWLNEIRFDTYHHHLVDDNPPTWPALPGILLHEWNGSDLTLFWNAAVDQTGPIGYELYFENHAPGFGAEPEFAVVEPSASEYFDWEITLPALALDQDYYAVLRARDGATPAHLDANTRTVFISSDPNAQSDLATDGYFNDWLGIEPIEAQTISEEAGDTPLPACDLVDIWVAHDDDYLYYSCSFAADPEISEYFYHVFLDTDGDAATGFHSGEAFAGAEYMCENGSLWRYTGSNDSWSWEFAGTTTIIQGVVESNRLEGNISRLDLGQTSESLRLVFNVNDNQDPGPDDYAPDDFTTNAYTYVMPAVSIDEIAAPQHFEIRTYPNPFNAAVTFKFITTHGSETKARLEIVDLQGRIRYQRSIQTAENSEYIWDGLDSNRRPVESGVYMYRLIRKDKQEGQVLSAGKLLALK